MKKAAVVIASVLSFSFPLADRAYAMAQISMQNNSKLWLNLYIDSNFGCGPVMPGGFCTSSVKEGPHLLEAKKGEEVMSYEKGVNIGDGTSPTWTVTIEDPYQLLIKKLDGTRYVNQEAWPLEKIENELAIRGTTLVWRTRVIWATPEIAQYMASGTNGFKQRPVGTWYDRDQMQIVGRTALYHKVYSSGSVEEDTFTISEDGNIIADEANNGRHNIYQRQ
ncbi:MAG: hypothetical protein ACLPSL_00335 [Smithella sp.]